MPVTVKFECKRRQNKAKTLYVWIVMKMWRREKIKYAYNHMIWMKKKGKIFLKCIYEFNYVTWMTLHEWL